MNLKYDILEFTREYRRIDVREWLSRHRHGYALGYIFFYLIAFFLTEQLVTPKYIISCPLDSLIPFSEYFVIPYLIWFLLLPASWIFTLIYSKKDFQDLCMVMFGGMTVSIILYWLFPNGLELRPGSPGGGICGELVRMIQTVDTPGNVCPSIHVSSSSAVAAVAYHSRILKKNPGMRWGIYLITVCICLSTMFLKQHSVIDVVCGLLLTAVLSAGVYHLPWRRWMRGSRMEFFL